MAIPTQAPTVEYFDEFVSLPQNADKRFEFIGGEIIEVPSNPYSSKIAMLIGAMILFFVQKKKLGHVTGEAGGYMVAGERYAPDVAYISYAKQAELPKVGYNPNPPDLAVEVLSSDTQAEANALRIKVSNYMAVGTVVWVVDPNEKQIEVHAVGQPVKIYTEADTLDGGDVLPEFQLVVKDLFTTE